MENSNYRVKIKDIYVGKVQDINTSEIKISHDRLYSSLLDDEDDLKWVLQNKSFLFKKSSDFIYYGDHSIYPCTFTRSMLFTTDENNHANDLLYNSPHYPIFDISQNVDIFNTKICIGHCTFELYEVLKLLGYPDEIGYNEVLKIRNSLFNCDYVMHNCQKLGIIETPPERTAYDGFDSSGRYMTFNDEIEGFPLYRSHFDGIMLCKDIYVPGEGVIDSFKPNEKEGLILTLKK